MAIILQLVPYFTHINRSQCCSIPLYYTLVDFYNFNAVHFRSFVQQIGQHLCTS